MKSETMTDPNYDEHEFLAQYAAERGISIEEAEDDLYEANPFVVEMELDDE